jgi:hypothetical protein
MRRGPRILPRASPSPFANALLFAPNASSFIPSTFPSSPLFSADPAPPVFHLLAYLHGTTAGLGANSLGARKGRTGKSALARHLAFARRQRGMRHGASRRSSIHGWRQRGVEGADEMERVRPKMRPESFGRRKLGRLRLHLDFETASSTTARSLYNTTASLPCYSSKYRTSIETVSLYVPRNQPRRRGP